MSNSAIGELLIQRDKIDDLELRYVKSREIQYPSIYLTSCVNISLIVPTDITLKQITLKQSLLDLFKCLQLVVAWQQYELEQDHRTYIEFISDLCHCSYLSRITQHVVSKQLVISWVHVVVL